MEAAQRVALQLPPRRAAQDDIKKATISRAEGGQLQAPVRPHAVHTYAMVPFLWADFKLLPGVHHPTQTNQ